MNTKWVVVIYLFIVLVVISLLIIQVGEFLSLFPKQLQPLTDACQRRFGANASGIEHVL
jgi:hypothetical protein